MDENTVAEFDEESRREVLERYFRLKEAYAKGRSSKPRKSLVELEPLAHQKSEVQESYFARLPRQVLSRCPHCDAPLTRAFDPWGPDGLWWQHGHHVEYHDVPACPHFVVLTGAVDPNGVKPDGVNSDAILGGDKPFIIPKILSRSGMIAVIGRLEMLNGFIAYPIAYFFKDGPLDSTLTQPWTVETMASPGGGWGMDTSEWDFELMPWAEREKIRWADPDSDDMVLSTNPPRAFPYANCPGEGKQLIIRDNDLVLTPAPDGQPTQPFE